jgi:hypothetical protein
MKLCFISYTDGHFGLPKCHVTFDETHVDDVSRPAHTILLCPSPL